DDHRGDLGEGDHRAGDSAPRRFAFWACGGRVRGMDGGDARPQRVGAPLPDLDADVHHGPARGSDPCRDRCALRDRSRQRRAPRRPPDARPLPGVPVTGDALSDGELLARADIAAARAYAPYSGFHVGCAVSTRGGEVIEGVNVENAAYPLGVCAERSAFARAISEGHRPGDFVAAAITASPCGGWPQGLLGRGGGAVVFPDGGAPRTLE